MSNYLFCKVTTHTTYIKIIFQKKCLPPPFIDLNQEIEPKTKEKITNIQEKKELFLCNELKFITFRK